MNQNGCVGVGVCEECSADGIYREVSMGGEFVSFLLSNRFNAVGEGIG